jgi:hypothetical protein
MIDLLVIVDIGMFVVVRARPLEIAHYGVR